MDDSVLNQLCVGDSILFLLTKVRSDEEDGFDLTVWDNKDAWRGTIEADDLSALSRKAKMKLPEFVKQTKSALTAPSSDSYTYTSAIKGNTRTLVWKKHLPAEDVKFQLGCVDLVKVKNGFAVVQEILSHSVSKTLQMQKTISWLEATNQRLSAERASALKRLDKCVSAKEDIENDLYSKFATVVNDKKAKIRSLVKELEEKPSQDIPLRNNDQAESDYDSEQEKKSSKKQTKSADSTESENDTDEEHASSPAKQPRVPLDPAAEKSPLLEGETSFGGGRRRIRAAATSKKQTPSKPVIPRVSSGETPSTSGLRKRSSSRKSATSSRSSDNLDADDLMEEL